METLEDLSEALAAMGDIQSIVRTMKALSSVSIRQYEQAEAAMAGYARTVELGLVAVFRQRWSEGRMTPVREQPAGRAALIVIGSDRGLCGAYNDRITRFARARLQDRPMQLGVVGARAAASFEAEGLSPAFSLGLPGSVDGLSRLVQGIIVEIDRWRDREDVRQVWLVHNRREGSATALPREHRLIPMPDIDMGRLVRAGWPGRSLPLFRMDPDRLISWLVQQQMFVALYRGLAEALASEHASRLVAMQAAARNIEERREDLQQRYRQCRQETITRELLDVVSGFEAIRSAD